MSEQQAKNENGVRKTEILFLYESKYSEPNGDPYTGEQRFDEETKKILVSDVRIKRFIRDYLEAKGFEIFVRPPKLDKPENEAKAESKKDQDSGASLRFQELRANPKFKDIKDPKELLLQCIDARLFGGIVTIKDKSKNKNSAGEAEKKDKAFNLTGAVQFALLNPSLNSQNLRPHQNTSRFVSRESNKQGAIATKSLVPYSLNQIHGWVNPLSAKETKLTKNDVETMLSAMWHSVNNAHTRTKCNQDSLLLLEIVYNDENRKLYGLDRLLRITPKEGMREEQMRSLDDCSLDLSKLIEKIASSEFVESVNYYSENDALLNQIDKKESSSKFKKIVLKTIQNQSE
jgi:CRISPR-associated protein Csh2